MDSGFEVPVEIAVFLFPPTVHVRKHGPQGYTDYTSYKDWLRDEFTFRCAYCLAREKWEKDGHAVFSIDHFMPLVEDDTKICDYDNLYYVCLRCNYQKSGGRAKLNPCVDNMSEHLRIMENGEFEHLTLQGFAHILFLDLNDPELVEYRLRVMESIRAAWESKDAARIRRWLGFPLFLPNLKAMRPPDGNAGPSGVIFCHYELQSLGALPDSY